MMPIRGKSHIGMFFYFRLEFEAGKKSCNPRLVSELNCLIGPRFVEWVVNVFLGVIKWVDYFNGLLNIYI